MAEKAFTATRFAWRKDIQDRLRRGGEDAQTDAYVLEALARVAVFLDKNGLWTRRLTRADGSIGRDFVLKSDDVNELGLQVLKAAFGKWEKKGGNPEDVVLLERALQRLKH